MLLRNLVNWVMSATFTLQSSILLLVIGTFVWLFLIPVIEAAERTVLQRSIPYERQGRVFGFAQMVENAASPLTALCIGPLAEVFFMPLMTDGRAPTGSAAGSAPGRNGHRPHVHAVGPDRHRRDPCRPRLRLLPPSVGSRTFVAISDDRIVGYYSLSTFAIARREATTRAARNMPDPIPAMLLGRLAVDRSVKGQGLGKGLLRDAIVRTLQVAEHAGVRGLFVHAIAAAARHWYAKFGFEPSPTQEMELIVLLDDVRVTLGL